jgi:hypothetical protein
VRDFMNYIEAGSRFPMHFVPKNERGGEVSITSLPKVQIVRCALRHYYHLSDAEFWDMPWGLAQWDYYTAPVLEGRADIVSPSSFTRAQDVADDLFRKYNPTLFGPDGKLTDEGRKILIEKGLLCPS